METEKNSPVRPRDAAVMILLRGSPLRREVLMGRRSKKSRFMPDVYVFPGGAVDRDDGRVNSISELNDSIIPYMSVSGRFSHARRLALAAVRETFEETGLVVGESGDIGDLKHPVWKAYRQYERAPSLSTLNYVGRAITPAFLPMRFHARFFLHETSEDLGPLGGDGELVDLQWLELHEALRLPLADVTEFMLRHVIDLIEAENRIKRYPVFTYQHNAPRIKYGVTSV